LTVDVSLPDDGLVPQVPLQVNPLALAARATAYLLPIVQQKTVVAAKHAATVLAGTGGRMSTPPNEPSQLAVASQDASSRS
jgi:hypothetical protein